jgi:hypothetical protein
LKCASPTNAGHQRDREQRDQPRRVDDEPGGEADDRHDVLRLREQLADQARAPARLAARALEPVLHLAVLEVLEVERRRRAPSGAGWSRC